MRNVIADSPVELIRKQLPQGKGDWPGYDHVYKNISDARHKMATDKFAYLSDEHVYAMAVLGCGHEETMKAEQMFVRDRKWI